MKTLRRITLIILAVSSQSMFAMNAALETGLCVAATVYVIANDAHKRRVDAEVSQRRQESLTALDEKIKDVRCYKDVDDIVNQQVALFGAKRQSIKDQISLQEIVDKQNADSLNIHHNIRYAVLPQIEPNPVTITVDHRGTVKFNFGTFTTDTVSRNGKEFFAASKNGLLGFDTLTRDQKQGALAALDEKIKSYEKDMRWYNEYPPRLGDYYMRGNPDDAMAAIDAEHEKNLKKEKELVVLISEQRKIMQIMQGKKEESKHKKD